LPSRAFSGVEWKTVCLYLESGGKIICRGIRGRESTHSGRKIKLNARGRGTYARGGSSNHRTTDREFYGGNKKSRRLLRPGRIIDFSGKGRGKAQRNANLNLLKKTGSAWAGKDKGRQRGSRENRGRYTSAVAEKNESFRKKEALLSPNLRGGGRVQNNRGV